ncbi:MAG: helix-turn-helix domain-containing protein [Prevotella sp.]
MKRIIPYIFILSVTLVIACCKGDDRRHDDIQYTNILNANPAETVNTDSPTISIREHEMEIHRLQTKFIIALIVIILVSILVYFIFLTKLNRKNIALIRQAKETEQAERLSAQTLRQMPRERLDNDQQLFSKLLDMMEGQEKPYTDPACNRETLAQLCATNGKYIDRIISHFADGKTTNEFITHYRLRRAMTLLADTDETVDGIAELCGFSSTRTFYRRFHDKVGMSPTEYRNLQTESEMDGSL